MKWDREPALTGSGDGSSRRRITRGGFDAMILAKRVSDTWVASARSLAMCLVIAVLLAGGLYGEGTGDEGDTARGAEVVTTAYGPVTGHIDNGTWSFKGIPYAAPPLGELRWRAPQPLVPWSESLAAAEFGPACRQARQTQIAESEDCLTLNVWTPFEGPGSKLPVMVWVHGGGSINGSGRAEGHTFARDGVVLVSINYRLGRLGVFDHPALAATRPAGEPSANFGTLDQIAALRWVQRNIAGFGGDPDRVTIFGVSAGGSSVNRLMVSPLAAGLFRGAIAESGGNGLSVMRRREESGALPSLFEAGLDFARATGAADADDVAAALRALPAEEVAPRNTGRTYRGAVSAVVDGQVIPDDPGKIFSDGGQNDAAYIGGANAFEGSLAIAIPASDAFTVRIAKYRDRLERLYGVTDDDRRLALEVYGDVFFHAPTRYLVTQSAKSGRRSWRYRFEYVVESMRATFDRARHGGEVPFVFDALPPGGLTLSPGRAAAVGVGVGTYPISSADLAMARTIHDQWIRFAETGDPNGPGLPVWPPSTGENDVTLVFAGAGVSAQTDLYQERLDFIEGQVRPWPAPLPPE